MINIGLLLIFLVVIFAIFAVIKNLLELREYILITALIAAIFGCSLIIIGSYQEFKQGVNNENNR